jgi:hypothetical protein
MVSRNLNEYLQIDLLSLHAVTSIKTQGRFGKGQGQEFTEAYVVEYWRPSFGNKWKRWKNVQGKEVRSPANPIHITLRASVSGEAIEFNDFNSECAARLKQDIAQLTSISRKQHFSLQLA